MQPYIILWWGLLVSYLFYFLKNRKLSGLLFSLMALWVILLPAIRDISIGTDTVNYVDYFQNPNSGYHGNVDIGYNLFIKTLHGLTNSLFIYLFISAAISVGSIIYFIKKESVIPIVSLFLFTVMGRFYQLQFAGMRQSLAIALFLGSIYSLYSLKEIKKAGLLYLLSCSIHATAIIMLPIYFLISKIKFTRKTLYIILIVSYIIGFSGMLDYRSLFESILSKIGDGSLERYSHYASFMKDHSLTIHRLIMDLTPYSLLMFLLIKRSSDVNDLYFKFAFVGVVLSNILVSFPITFRLLMYPLIFLIIVIPNTFYRKIKFDIAILSVTILYFSYKFYAELLTQLDPSFIGNKIVPYLTCF